MAESGLRAAARADLPALAPTHSELHEQFVQLMRAEIAQRLTAFAADVRTGRFPAGRPYQHVNGFTKFVVTEYECGARLTLHYWPAAPGARDDVSRPHDHRYPFASILLGGAQRFVEMEEADPAASPQRWRRFTYKPYLSGQLAAVVDAGEVGLRPLREVDRAPLDGHYSTSSTVVHQAVTSRRTACATLVLRGPRERRTSHVYYRPDEPVPRGGLQLGRRLARNEVTRQLDHAVDMVATMQ